MQRRLLGLMLAVVCPLLTQCASAGKGKKAGVELSRGGEMAAVKEEKVVVKAEAPVVDDLDEYSVVDVADPLERMNRVSFWCNDKMYLIVFRPISKGYEKV
ncbi:MAG: MlaA family lipoprotein, partial [Verrucomicrobiaceae bacterium]|nr:MlaA family lipoprotein [Verrucomicrobiaceae bacterium]